MKIQLTDTEARYLASLVRASMPTYMPFGVNMNDLLARLEGRPRIAEFQGGSSSTGWTSSSACGRS